MADELTAAQPMRPSARHHITDVTGLSGSQKAAILVQMILADGGKMDLGSLEPAAQMRFATDYASIVRVNRATLDAVVAEFEMQLETAGLEFPENLDDVLGNMEGLLAPDLTHQLRDRFGLGTDTDPWRAIVEMEPAEIAKMLGLESAYVGALILSKLRPEQANEVLELMEKDLGTAIVMAIANTGAVPPDPVHRIGTRVAAKSTVTTPKAFADTPVIRAASILNAASGVQRDEYLAAFEAKDESFAKQVRKAIFTFADIPGRVSETDVPKFVRAVPAEAMVMALTYAQEELQVVVDYILDNMSKRMAASLREEMVDLGNVATKPGEAAMSQVTSVIRALADDGTLKLVVEEEE